ncbi:MAG: ATP-grasp domain-containing protein [Desulfamplus sp.]|nr:ATP-grasp domain-containing protein [Desulfamplus sp.]
MQNQRTLVVGTTSDYIDMLRQKTPAQSLLFITAPAIRNNAVEERPKPDEELLCELIFPEKVISRLREHILTYSIELKGVACFDCDSMALAAHIAVAFALPYPSIETVMACRDKSRTRALWHANGVETPKYSRVSSASQAVDFFEKVCLCLPCVLKPVDSSGSERVFHCTTVNECEAAYKIICAPQQSPDIIIETCIAGTEYSCDFIVENNQVVPIRFARKIHAPVTVINEPVNEIHSPLTVINKPAKEIHAPVKEIHEPLNEIDASVNAPYASITVFGTIMAYELVEFPSENISEKDLLSLLFKGAKALGITRGICMVDFIVTENSASLLEMTPRPGGDCLPWLIEKAMNIDILKLNLDIAGQKEAGRIEIIKPAVYNPVAGLRIHATQAGTLKSINTQKIEADSRVREIFIKHKQGHKIILPPHDYDSWNLGHIIFNPCENIPCIKQCMQILSLLEIDIEI